VDARLRNRHLLLLTDFDGTLAELAPTPAEAVLTDEVRDVAHKTGDAIKHAGEKIKKLVD